MRRSTRCGCLNTGATDGFVPRTTAGTLDWPLAAVRVAGAALGVPLMEDLFWRSFLMRWLQAPVFEAVPPRAVALSTFVFVLVHTRWLADILAGLAYALLCIRTGKLWVAVMAHAVTNGLLKPSLTRPSGSVPPRQA